MLEYQDMDSYLVLILQTMASTAENKFQASFCQNPNIPQNLTMEPKHGIQALSLTVH